MASNLHPARARTGVLAKFAGFLFFLTAAAGLYLVAPVAGNN